MQDAGCHVLDLPDVLLGHCLCFLDSPKDRLSALLSCKRWLAAASAHRPLWEALAVADGRGDREGRFWAAHSQQVSSLAVGVSASRGGPGVFLCFLLGVAGPSGLPRLQRLEVQVPGGRNPGIVAVWFCDAFQAINRLPSLRHLKLTKAENCWDGLPHWDWFSHEQSLPLLIEPGALSCLESLVVQSPPYRGRTVAIPEGVLAGLCQLSRLELCGNLVRAGLQPGSPKPAAAPASATPACMLSWPDFAGTTALRRLCFHTWLGGGRLELSESEALSVLCQLEALEVGDPDSVGPGVWAALPQLPCLTRLAMQHEEDKVFELDCSPEPMLAAAACTGLQELVTNWLPPLGRFPPQLSSLTMLALSTEDYPPGLEPDPSWGEALPLLHTFRVWGTQLPAWLSGLAGSLQRLSAWLDWSPEFSPHPGAMIEPVLGLSRLTCLDLRCDGMTWELKDGPYLHCLQDLSILRVDAAAPIPPALTSATALKCLHLFPYRAREVHTRQYSDTWHEPGPPDPPVWDSEGLNLLRGLPCLQRLELIDYWAWWWWCYKEDGDKQPLKPEWQESAQALREGLEGAGVEVVARRATREESIEHRWYRWLQQPTQ